MNENQCKVASPNGKFSLSIGDVKEGSLNLITNFNTTKYLGFSNLLKDHPYVTKISSIQNYEDNLGGISIVVSSEFDYEIFTGDLTEIMEITLEHKNT